MTHPNEQQDIYFYLFLCYFGCAIRRYPNMRIYKSENRLFDYESQILILSTFG